MSKRSFSPRCPVARRPVSPSVSPGEAPGEKESCPAGQGSGGLTSGCLLGCRARPRANRSARPPARSALLGTHPVLAPRVPCPGARPLPPRRPPRRRPRVLWLLPETAEHSAEKEDSIFLRQLVRVDGRVAATGTTLEWPGGPSKGAVSLWKNRQAQRDAIFPSDWKRRGRRRDARSGRGRPWGAGKAVGGGGPALPLPAVGTHAGRPRRGSVGVSVGL